MSTQLYDNAIRVHRGRYFWPHYAKRHYPRNNDLIVVYYFDVGYCQLVIRRIDRGWLDRVAPRV